MGLIKWRIVVRDFRKILANFWSMPRQMARIAHPNRGSGYPIYDAIFAPLPEWLEIGQNWAILSRD